MNTLSLRIFLIGVGGAVVLSGFLSFGNSTRHEEIPVKIHLAFRKFLDEKYLPQFAYSSVSEYYYRLNVFYSNHLYIQSHNQNSQYQLELNKFADLTNEEWRAKHLALTDINLREYQNIMKVNKEVQPTPNDNPPQVNWFLDGIVSSIKDEGQCSAGYIFAPVAAVESKWMQKKGTLLDLSEQQVIDCAGSQYSTFGCNGGNISGVFNYIQNEGLIKNVSYPYAAKQNRCTVSTWRDATINGWTAVTANDGLQLETAVAQGVVTAAVDASKWQFYKRGVFKDNNCGTSLNHAVAIVGYGTAYTVDFWILKNSWGLGWGQSGYIRITKSTSKGKGQCGINMLASYPQVD